MTLTDQTLIEQMHIDEIEIESRKDMLGFKSENVSYLFKARKIVEKNIDSLVSEFYKKQTEIPEISLLIGDSGTLARLQKAQRKYILDLFSGVYDFEYVNNRLRIGLVHKRIGVEPKLYLAAINTLSDLLVNLIINTFDNKLERENIINSLKKLFMFDVTLVFEMYIRSMVSEIEVSRKRMETYAHTMEKQVKKRTAELDELSRTDPLTGLTNIRDLNQILTTVLRSAERRSEPVSFVFLDINNFKKINDTYGHQFGDDILIFVGEAIKSCYRAEDFSFRYGGDEFCVIMTNCTEEDAKKILVNRVNNILNNDSRGIKISAGIAQTGPKKFIRSDDLIKKADKKMYLEKNKRA